MNLIAPSSPPRCRTWLPATASAGLALVLYAITLGGTYIYDDAVIIGVDERVKSPRHWKEFWTKGYFSDGIDNLYRPLVSQSYGLQWWLHGDRPWAFHLVNLLMHAGVCALVAEVGRRLAGWRVGLVAGLLFAAHPVHSEVVAGIVGRAELGCALGMLGAMVVFLKHPMTYARATATLLLCLVAALSKEQGLLMPLLLAVLLLVRKSGAPDETLLSPATRRARRQPMLLLFGMLSFMTGGIIALREEVLNLKFEWDRGFLDIAVQPLIKSHGADRWLIPVSLIGRYFLLLVAPLKLSIDYGLDVITATISRSDFHLWLGFAVATVWIISCLVTFLRRNWVIFFCLAAMGLTYSMASNFVMIATIFGERLIYLPSIFFLLLVACLLTKLPTKVCGVLLILVLILGSARTFSYVRRWNNRDAFYAYTLEQQPKSLKAFTLLSFAYQEEGRYAEAWRLMNDAETMDPNYWELWKMSGIIDEKTENWERAVVDWRHAFDLMPSGVTQQHLLTAMQKWDKVKAKAATRPDGLKLAATRAAK